jgi:hypothetical protein
VAKYIQLIDSCSVLYSLYHIVTCLSDCILDLLDSFRFVTTSNCSAVASSQTLQFTRAHPEVFSACCGFSSCCSVAVLMVYIPFLWGFQTIPGLSYNLLTAMAHNDSLSSPLTNSPTNQHCTPLTNSQTLRHLNTSLLLF